MDKKSRVSTIYWAAILLFLLLVSCTSPSGEVIETAEPGGLNTVEATSPAVMENIDPTATQTPTIQSYPAPEADNLPEITVPDPYPAPTTAIAEAAPADVKVSAEVFLPITSDSSGSESSADTAVAPTATIPPTATMPPTATIPPTAIPTIDFMDTQAILRTNGKDLGFVKIGFHVTLLEDRDVLDEWMFQLDQAGVPFFVKAVDNAEPLFRAQELMKVSNLPHTLVYRSTGGEPLYELPPVQAAQIHWQEHRDKFPPELDPSVVWIETLNEPDRTKAEWFGQFALEMARLTMSEDFKWAAFSWASGEPEPEQWQTPSMLAFLQMAGENPNRLAIALHEYSFLKEDLAHEYPYKVGRFQELFRITDERGFARPTILITEWGWEHNNIPAPGQAMRDIQWASALYAPFPEVKGAGIWNLGIGCCFGDVSDQVQQIIEPLTHYSLTNYFEIPQLPEQQTINPEQFQP